MYHYRWSEDEEVSRLMASVASARALRESREAGAAMLATSSGSALLHSGAADTVEVDEVTTSLSAKDADYI